MIGEVPASRLRENTEGLQTTESTVLNYINSECTFFAPSTFMSPLLNAFHIRVQESSHRCRCVRAPTSAPPPVQIFCRESRRLAGGLTTRWSSAWWCRTRGWPPTATPLRSHLERRHSRLKGGISNHQVIWITMNKNTHVLRKELTEWKISKEIA